MSDFEKDLMQLTSSNEQLQEEVKEAVLATIKKLGGTQALQFFKAILELKNPNLLRIASEDVLTVILRAAQSQLSLSMEGLGRSLQEKEQNGE